MEKQASAHIHTDTTLVSPEGKYILKKLSPELESLAMFAKRKYGSHENAAREADDAQEKFTSMSVNFLHASNLVVQAVLRARTMELEAKQV